MPDKIFTIGHSNHKWDEFSALLREHRVELLVDTRSDPVSRYADFANSRALPRLLRRAGMRYVFMGDSLGGKPSDRSCYDEIGRPDYPEIRSRGFFQEGIEKLLELARLRRVVLMCAEEDPSKCHRRLLIGPALLEHDVDLLHIRGDGTAVGFEALGSKEAYQRQLQARLPLEEDDKASR